MLNVNQSKDTTPEEDFREYIERSGVPFYDAIQKQLYIEVGKSYGLTEEQIRGLKL